MQKTIMMALSTEVAEYYAEDRSCISASSSSGRDSSKQRLCTRTTLCASSGITTSSADGSKPSTSTSGSTSLTRIFRMARCSSSASLRRPSSRISSPRAYTTSSGRHASKASSARRSNLLKGSPSSRGGGSHKAQEGSQVESRRPLSGVLRHDLGMPRPELDIDFNPAQARLMTQMGSGRVR